MSVLAVVTARGGSKGLAGKNLLSLAGMPLIVHALRFAASCPLVDRTIVSTDSEAIAAVARAEGGDVPFIRPAELARDNTPILPVLRHALSEVDPRSETYDRVLLVSPTSPFRLPEDAAAMSRLLDASPDADGIVSVSDPGFDPLGLCVVERQGRMEHAFPEGAQYDRRQDAPPTLRINGALYLWRASFVMRDVDSWFDGRHRMYEMPRLRTADIDDADDLALCEAMVASRLVRLPWLD
jgi:N-acylneuraminate cytidylyltransferase